jgi:Zn-dependent metalloprotease
VLDRISQTGDEAQRARARRTIAVTEQARGRRAATGAMMLATLSTGTKRRTIYDAQHTTTLPGQLVRGEDGPASQDRAVEQAFAGSGDTYDFYRQILKRNSIDDHGMRLDSTVHFDRDFDNAFWNGQQMVYGDGDGVIFTNFTGCLDVIGHELTHGVTQHEANLVYSGQSGALNESISDVFGIQVKQMALGQDVTTSDWLIGADIVGDALKPALRSMKEPGHAHAGDDQPSDMDGYVPGGDVHTNSGIPNRAYSVAASALGGNAWDAAGPIWYAALRDPRLRPNATFRQFAEITLRQSRLIYGRSSREAQAVQDGWDAVKVKVQV